MSQSQQKNKVVSIMRLISGWFLVVIGLLITPLPIPVGLLIVLTGLSLLALESRSIRQRMQKMRHNRPQLNEKLERIKNRLPALLREVIEKTKPVPIGRRAYEEEDG